MASGSRSKKTLYCFYCGVDNTLLLRCVQCKSGWYCSRKHQKLHWNIHKSSCTKQASMLVTDNNKHPSLNTKNILSEFPSQNNSQNSMPFTNPNLLSFPCTPDTSGYVNTTGCVYTNKTDHLLYTTPTTTFTDLLEAENDFQEDLSGNLSSSSSFFHTPNPLLPTNYQDTSSDYFEDLDDIISGTVSDSSNTMNPIMNCKEYSNYATNTNSLILKPGTAEDRAVYVREQLLNHGYCIIDKFLDENIAENIFANVMVALESGSMKAGQVTKGGQDQLIRGDKVMWLTGQEEQYCYILLLMDQVDELMAALNKILTTNVIKGRTPAMVACYPGDGSGYKHHIDNTQKDGRVITCLFYLNKGWNCENDGGMLRLFPLGKRMDIAPYFNRLLTFWSDKRTPHEVLPAYRQRLAITLWYFDATEREIVRQAYFAKLRSQFASQDTDNDFSSTIAT